MTNPDELPRLIEVHPTRGGVAAAIVGGPEIATSETLLVVDLGYDGDDHEIATRQLETLLRCGFSNVSGLEESYPPVYDWSYRATLGDEPTSSHITLMADDEHLLVYDGIFLTSPFWFAVEAEAQSAAIAIGNFQFLQLRPYDEGFDSRLILLTEAALAMGQVVGASVGRTASRRM